jgi:hypothetical protein
MGIREFLFLWSSCVLLGTSFERTLKGATYNPNRDTVTFHDYILDGYSTFKVTREASGSCAILGKHGIMQSDIDAAVNKFLAGLEH